MCGLYCLCKCFHGFYFKLYLCQPGAVKMHDLVWKVVGAIL